MECEHWVWMESLEWEHVELLQQQVGIQAWTVKAEDTDCWALDTFLALAVASMLPTT